MKHRRIFEAPRLIGHLKNSISNMEIMPLFAARPSPGLPVGRVGSQAPMHPRIGLRNLGQRRDTVGAKPQVGHGL